MPEYVRSTTFDNIATTTFYIAKFIFVKTKYAGWIFHFQSIRGELLTHL